MDIVILKMLTGDEYAKRFSTLISEAFTKDIQDIITVDAISIKSSYISDYTYNKNPYNPSLIKTNFGMLEYSNDNEKSGFGSYQALNDKPVRVFCRIFNEEFNYVESDDGQVNLNEQFDKLASLLGRKINFYKSEEDKKASELVQELSEYFSKSHLVLYKILTEEKIGYNSIYFVKYNSLFSSSTIQQNLFIFKNPFDIFKDVFFLKSIDNLLKGNTDAVSEVNSGNIKECLELYKVLDY